jgi:hypothetical protein
MFTLNAIKSLLLNTKYRICLSTDKKDMFWAGGLGITGMFYCSTLITDHDKIDKVSKIMLGIIAFSYFGKSAHHMMVLKKIVKK